MINYIQLLLSFVTLTAFFAFMEISYSTNFEKITVVLKNEYAKKMIMGPMIEGISRFEWYRFNASVRWDHLEPTKINPTTLSAYEFPYEISVSLTDWNFLNKKVYCRYLDSNNAEILPADVRFAWPEYIVNCKKRKNAKRIGLSMEESNKFKSIEIMDRTDNLNQKKFKLGMCLSPLYGEEPKWMMLVESIEHYRLQGVDHFYIYTLNISNYDLKVLQSYGDVVDIIPIGPPDNSRKDFEWQTAHLADCLLRSRETKWTIFGDLDEKILMEKGTIREYMEGIEEDEMIGGVRFRQQYVLKHQLMPEKYEGEEQLLKWLPTLRWNYTTGIAPFGYASKCIIDSEKVLRMDIHSIGSFFPGNGYKLLEVPGDVGVIRHYRDLYLGNWSKTSLRHLLQESEPAKTISYPIRFHELLILNVRKKLEQIYRT